ncbi:serine hydrolase domain-containing protein [Luteimonas sp. JM171]|uniref:serine hydrolase domain-containing protein n=1 Tax=Luteimonas sp. JM171 TaxID=1896164 RepID=UPI000A7B9110|nr:serine hydrolase domain-containing protein [Luteimonas sp. JM171]
MRRSNRASRALVLGAAFLLALSAPGFTVAADIGEKLSALMAEHDAVGLAVVVVRDNEIVYRQSLGWKDRQARIPLEEGDVFRIASISKSFAAASILQLVEQGRLSLDDDVGELLGFPVRNPGFPDHSITLRMLLNHTSSITDSQRYGSLDIINPDANDSWSESYSEYAPGEQYEYSNLGYNMVGAIIEQASGQRFDRYVKEHVLEPLELYGGHWPDALDADRFARIYRYHEGEGFVRSDAAYALLGERLEDYRLGYSAPLFSPTGGMKITASDLARYMLMHMNQGEWAGVRIISQAHAALMQAATVPVDDSARYGLGLRTDNSLVPGVTLVGHTGSAYGLYSSMFFDADRKYGFVVITNGVRDPDLRAAVNQALHAHFIGPLSSRN